MTIHLCIDRSPYLLVVVVLPDPFRGKRAWRNSLETQQSGHAPRSGSEVKNGRSIVQFSQYRRRMQEMQQAVKFLTNKVIWSYYASQMNCYRT